MARVKPAAEPVLKSWEEVDAATSELRDLSIKRAAIEARLAAQLDRYREGAKQRTDPLDARASRLEHDVREFCDAHASDFAVEPRSRKLTKAVVGFRKSSAIDPLPGWTLKKVVELLQQMVEDFRKSRKLKDALAILSFLRIKTELNKEAVRNALTAGTLTEDQLAKWGLRDKETDAFYIEFPDDKPAEVAEPEPVA